jgi:superfamily II DNA/RNA helicase
MGFIPDIERIAKMIPFTRQTLFFSATMPPEIQKLADRFLQNPERVEVAKPSSTTKTITQRIVASHNKDYEKRAVLRDLIKAQDELKNAIIFCNRKKDVADLFRSLERHGFSVGALHGDMDQRSRTAMLQGFKDNQITLLVASDVAARGLDIPDVSHVFNFDVPIHAEDYVHRIGRTGRAGRSGKAFTVVTKSDAKYLDAIEKLINEKIEWLSGDLSELGAPMESYESGDKGRKGRDKGRGDKDRGRDRGRRGASSHSDDTKQVDTVAVSAPKETVSETTRTEVVNAEAKQDTRRQPNGSRNARPYPANDDNGREQRRQRHHRDHDDGPTPVGFGDDIPAFMLIAGKA